MSGLGKRQIWMAGIVLAAISSWTAGLAVAADGPVQNTAIGKTAKKAPVNMPVQTVAIPVSIDGETLQLVAKIYRPLGPGPFPLLMLNHGSSRKAEQDGVLLEKYAPQAQRLAQRGFVVIAAMRRGYGTSDGVRADGFGQCRKPDYAKGAQAAVVDIKAALDYGRSLPYVDPLRVVLLGKSAGAFASLALAAQTPPGVVGVINVSGGRGSHRPDEVCDEDQLSATISSFARTTKVPNLWLYAENDRSFSQRLIHQWTQAYKSSGVKTRLVVLPAWGKNGHEMFESRPAEALWLPPVDDFLRQLGFQWPEI